MHELYYDGSRWRHNDLTQLANAPDTDEIAYGFDGYTTPFNQQQHVNFFVNVGGKLHVWELYYDGAWHWNDLTQLTNAPPALPGSRPDGYATLFNQQQHVNFIGTEQHIHELYYDGTRWRHNDLTQLTGAPNAFNNGIDGYETSFNSQQHVNFIGIDNHVHELYYDGTRWRDNDLSALAM